MGIKRGEDNINGLLPLQELGVGWVVPKTQRTRCAPRWGCEGRFWLIRCIYEAGFVSVTNDGRISSGRYRRTTRMRRTNERRSIRLSQDQMEDAATLLELPKSECLDMWVRLPLDQWPKSWHHIEEPAVPLERNLHGHPLAGLLWSKTIWKSYSGRWMGENYQPGNACSCIVSKFCSYLCSWTTSKWLGRSTISNSRGRNSWNTLIWRNLAPFLDKVYFGWNSCWRIPDNVRAAESL